VEHLIQSDDRRGHGLRHSFVLFLLRKNQQSFITWPFNFDAKKIE
jgi:hypothetical protein